MVLAWLVVSSALFAGSVDVSSSNAVQIDVSGDWDCHIYVYDANSNQLMADFIIYTGSASAYNGAWTYADGLSAYVGETSGYVTGLPEGTYRVVTEEPFPSSWYSYSSSGGSYGYISDYYYYGYDVMNYSVSTW